MITKLSVSNYKLFDDFSIDFGESRTTLLVGRNGTGKSSIRNIIQLLGAIARDGRLSEKYHLELISNAFDAEEAVKILAQIRLEDGTSLEYQVSIDLSTGSPRFQFETIVFGSESPLVLDRRGGVYNVNGYSPVPIPYEFSAIAHFATKNQDSLVEKLQRMLAHILVIAPVPDLIQPYSVGRSSRLDVNCSNLIDWLLYLVHEDEVPYDFQKLEDLMRNLIPDLDNIFLTVVPQPRLLFRFNSVQIDHTMLSDGEKCTLLLCILKLWKDQTASPICFWDEPDNFLSIDEAYDHLTRLRRMFSRSGQLICASHHPEAVRAFGPENVLVLYRESHSHTPKVHKGIDAFKSGDFGFQLTLGDGLRGE